MLNLGGTGMGTSGMGVSGGGGMGAGGGMNLQQLLAMLQAQHAAGGGMSPGPTMTSPMSQGGAATPMANYIGGGMGGGMGGGVMPNPPVAAPTTIGGGAPGAAGAAQGGNMQGLMQLMQAMKGGQTGVMPQGQSPAGSVAPAGGQLPQAQNPEAMGWLMSLLHGGGGAPPAGGMT